MDRKEEIKNMAAYNAAHRFGERTIEAMQYEHAFMEGAQFADSTNPDTAKLKIAVEALELIERDIYLDGERRAHQDYAKDVISKIKGEKT